jgi:hypothetical protein
VIEKVARKSTPDAMGCVMRATFGLDFAMTASSDWLMHFIRLADRQQTERRKPGYVAPAQTLLPMSLFGCYRVWTAT